MIPLFKTENSSLNINNLPLCMLSRQWNGCSSDRFIGYTLLEKPDFFEINVQFFSANNYDTTLTPGTFKEGLWEQDVFEVFMKYCDDDISYLELNLSPTGAFWLSGFAAPRVEVQSEKIKSLIESVEVSVSNNTVKFLMKRPNFLTLNICACLGNKAVNRSYLSETTLPQLDFHLVKHFKKANSIYVY